MPHKKRALKEEVKKSALSVEIFRTYDVRGIYPQQLNEKAARLIAKAYCRYVKPKTLVVGRDVRSSGASLKDAIVQAFREEGIGRIIDVGIVPVDVFYFAINHFATDGGIFISASHNPRMWNGMNLARSQAVGISRGTGMEKIEKLAFAIEKKEVMGSAISERKQERIVYEKTDVIPAYFQFLKKIHPLTIKKRFAVVADGNHGASAELFQKFVKASKLPITVFPLRANLDGTLPQGEPNPLHVENHKPLLVEVKKKKADFGIAWDADGDRVFFVDEKGVFIPTYYASAAIIESMLKNQHHKKTERQKPAILVDTRQYWLTRDITKENGGKWAFTKPGMTVVASAMKKKKAIFGSETSAHYYFQKTFNRDNGFLPILYVLELLDQKKCALSELMAPFFKTYAISQEINFTFPGSTDPKKILSAIEKKYQRGKISHFEGLMVEFDSWRFSVRSSNTERLIRLNVEAVSEKILKEELGKIKNVISWLR